MRKIVFLFIVQENIYNVVRLYEVMIKAFSSHSGDNGNGTCVLVATGMIIVIVHVE